MPAKKLVKQVYGKGDYMNTNKLKKIGSADLIIYFILLLISFIMLYPVLYMFSVSLSDINAVVRNEVKFYPVGFSLEAYRMFLKDARILKSYYNTIVYSILGTFFSLSFTSLMAYPLSIRSFCMKKFNTVFLTITMFIGGGLIPYYMTIRNLGMVDTIWVIVIPGSVGAWNVIIYKTFFLGIPDSLRESAYIDGANDILILFRIILPVSKALLATMGLFSIVGIWNDFFTALIFINTNSKQPLQILLRSILILNTFSNTELDKINKAKEVNTQTVKAAAIVVAVLPLMIIYPFLQKYFAKGILIGSIKG